MKVFIEYILHDEIIHKLLLAAVLGGMLGLERQRHGRVAGLRTHMLVCIASTILMTTAHILMKSSSFAQLAPSRLAAGIMTGMGFIGAGTIIRAHHSVRGLTTSACLWLTAALGVVIGSHEYMLAIKASVISYIILAFLGKMDTYMKTEAFQVLIVRTTPESGQLHNIKKICNECGGKVMDTSIIRGKEKHTLCIGFILNLRCR